MSALNGLRNISANPPSGQKCFGLARVTTPMMAARAINTNTRPPYMNTATSVISGITTRPTPTAAQACWFLVFAIR